MDHSAEVAAVRRFTRFYTRQIELLDEHLLRTAFSLTEARVLFELAQAGPTTAAALAAGLGIDPGYLSRILKGFDARGFLARSPSDRDGRRTELALTDAGRDAFAPLDRASAEQVAGLLAPLSGPERRALAESMAAVERLLGRASAVEAKGPPFRLRALRTGDLGAIVRGQGLLYAREFGWDETFEALVAEIGAAFVKAHDPERERAWIAEGPAGDVLGSVFLVRASEAVAKLRLLYVEPAARGLGLGRTLVETCIGFAREAGYRELTLWTNDVLVSARRIYEAAGFRLVESEPHRSFGRDLVGQVWSLDL